MKKEIEDSINLVKKNYKFYNETHYKNRWDLTNFGNRYSADKLKQKVSELLKESNITIKNKKILDVGCGDGNLLTWFHHLGVDSNNLYGVDINDANPIFKKKEKCFKFKTAEASNLLFKEKSFDIVVAFTLFSSVLNKTHREAVAREILRVLKKDGVILIYDLRFDNPFNRRVMGIRKDELKRLFGAKQYDFIKTTINPVILRRVKSNLVIKLLDKLDFLKSHYLTIIR